MINLKAIYGNKIFNRKKSYANTRYLPVIAGIILDIFVTYGIVKIFKVNWDYAYIKVYGILCSYSLLKYIFSSCVDLTNYKLFTKNALSSEISHYLNLFSSNVNWSEISTYDDFLLESSFNQSLSDKLRVLAAINYGQVAGIMSFSPRYENRCYEVFGEIIPAYVDIKYE